MTNLTKEKSELKKEEILSNRLVQLKNIKIPSFFITDPEGGKIEIKKTEDRHIVFTSDGTGKALAIEERTNGTKLYHISEDSTGLPSSHEIRPDKIEIVYFYNKEGVLQHFVELKSNGDRVSTILGQNGTLYSIDQKQIGGIVFQAWIRDGKAPKEGMIWLHPDGEVSTYGNKSVILELKSRFARFLDGITD